MNELVDGNCSVDSSKGADPYGLCPGVQKSFKFFTLSLILHLSNTSLDTGFWPFSKVPVRLLEKAVKNYSKAPSYRPICLPFFRQSIGTYY